MSRVKVALAVLLAVFVGSIAWQIYVRHDPVYQGRPLSFWLDQGRRHDWLDPRAEAAVKAMGRHAVPALLDLAETRDSNFRKTLIDFSNKQDWPSLRVRSHEEILAMTEYGFRLLGPAAKPAVPRLVWLLHNEAPETRSLAAYCLGDIGPDAEEAVSALSEYLAAKTMCRTNSKWDEKGIYSALYALGRIGQGARPAASQVGLFTNDSDWSIRWRARATLIQITKNGLEPVIEALQDTSNPTNWVGSCMVLGFLGSEGSNAVPALLRAADQGDWHVQEKAIETLGKIHTQPEVCIPRIKPFLHATNDWVRLHSLSAIGAFGTNAHGLAPTSDIIRCLGDSSALVRQTAANLLLYLEPEAAAKAGVATEP